MIPDLVVARAPHRISLVGGGSDLPEYYRRFGGSVISTAIDLYNTAVVAVSAETTEIHVSRTDGTHVSRGLATNPLVAGVLAHYDPIYPLTVLGARSLQEFGSGLGSSSSYLVALVSAVEATLGRSPTPAETAELAYGIERSKCGFHIGKQDHYAAAYGGLRKYDFEPDGSVKSMAIKTTPQFLSYLHEHTLMVKLPGHRHADHILRRQGELLQCDDAVLKKQQCVTALVPDMQAALEEEDVAKVGRIMHENWMLKRGLSSAVSNPHIDSAYEAARASGALGGKVLGAGGGGHMFLIVPPKRREAVRHVLDPCRGLNFNWTSAGVRVTRFHGVDAAPHSQVAEPQKC